MSFAEQLVQMVTSKDEPAVADVIAAANVVRDTRAQLEVAEARLRELTGEATGPTSAPGGKDWAGRGMRGRPPGSRNIKHTTQAAEYKPPSQPERILDTLKEAKSVLSIRDIEKRTGIPYGSVVSALQTLRGKNLVTHLGSGGYQSA